jgi:hypothetical protein
MNSRNLGLIVAALLFVAAAFPGAASGAQLRSSMIPEMKVPMTKGVCPSGYSMQKWDAQDRCMKCPPGYKLRPYRDNSLRCVQCPAGSRWESARGVCRK